MKADQYSSVGAEYRKESQRIEPKVIFFGATLLMSHFLEITPSEFDAGGIKIAVEDVTVIHGGLALVFLYYFWTLVASVFQGSALLPIATDRRVARYLISSAQKPYKDEKTKRMVRRSPKEAKRLAWRWMAAYNLFMTPFGIMVLGVILGALGVGLYDTWEFGKYLLNRLANMDA